jgi:hypothetical protein
MLLLFVLYKLLFMPPKPKAALAVKKKKAKQAVKSAAKKKKVPIKAKIQPKEAEGFVKIRPSALKRLVKQYDKKKKSKAAEKQPQAPYSHLAPYLQAPPISTNPYLATSAPAAQQPVPIAQSLLGLLPSALDSLYNVGRQYVSDRVIDQVSRMPPEIERFIATCGNEPILGITLLKVPVTKTSVLLAIAPDIADSDVNANYHMAQVLKLRDSTHLFYYRIEKNSTNVSVRVLSSNESDFLTKQPDSGANVLDLKVTTGITVKQYFDNANTEARANQVNLWRYDHLTANSRQFIVTCLSANQMLTPAAATFLRAPAGGDYVGVQHGSSAHQMLNTATDIGTLLRRGAEHVGRRIADRTSTFNPLASARFSQGPSDDAWCQEQY